MGKRHTGEEIVAKLRQVDVLCGQGKALAYTGAAINDAKVRYRVVREVRYPIWWGWFYSYRMPGQQGASQEIARGTALTRSDGSFSIEFLAKPDLSVPESDEPTFVYTVHADVTDTTGETRSADRGVHVGYTALAAQVTAPEWLTDDKAVPLLCYVLNHSSPRGKLVEVHAQIIEALGGLSAHAESTRTLRTILYRSEWWAPFRTAALRGSPSA